MQGEDAVWTVPRRQERRRQQQQQWRTGVERERAARSAAMAASHEAQAKRGPESRRPLHARLGALHRRMEERHLASAQMHGFLAAKIEKWVSSPEGALRPVFLAAIAEALGASSALAVLNGRQRGAAVVGASDRTALAAHDLELVMAEGPTRDVGRSGAPVEAAGLELAERWPQYGTAVAELGVHAVVAAPLGLPGARIGALCALGREPEIAHHAVAAASLLAGTFTWLLLRPTGPPRPDDDSPGPSLFDGLGDLAVVHQAAGMVSVHCDCGIDDAQDLLAMRGFAEGVPVAEIAAQVVTGQLRFG